MESLASTCCPKPEDLCELLDGSENEELSRHIRNCPKCQANLDQFRQVDSLVRKAYAAPAGLSVRIQEACAKEAERQEAEQLWAELAPKLSVRKPRRFFTEQLLATAAALVGVAVLSAVITARHYHANESAAALADAIALPRPKPVYVAKPLPVAPRTEVPVQIAAQGDEGFSLADSRQLQLARAHALESLEMVSSDARQPHAATTLRQLVLLPNSVEHVWISKHGQAPLDTLRKIQKDYPEGIEEISAPDELGIVTVKLQMTDQRVQAMVNALEASGDWNLLSPGYPQPGQEEFVAFRDQSMQYTMKLLPAH